MKIKVSVHDDAEIFVGAVEEEEIGVGINSEVINVSVNDYDELINKPKINNVELQGNLSLSNLGIVNDASFVYTQAIPSSVWTITHNLNKFPSIIIVDSGDSVVIGDCKYINSNTVQCVFSGEFTGKAYLN